MWFHLLFLLFFIGNSIEDEGAKALGEALKTNATLAELNLGDDNDIHFIMILLLLFVNFFINNKIGDEGAKAIAEALKTNKTLTEINLGSDNNSNNIDMIHLLVNFS